MCKKLCDERKERKPSDEMDRVSFFCGCCVLLVMCFLYGTVYPTVREPIGETKEDV